jgi:hypothetical protein
MSTILSVGERLNVESKSPSRNRLNSLLWTSVVFVLSICFLFEIENECEKRAKQGCQMQSFDNVMFVLISSKLLNVITSGTLNFDHINRRVHSHCFVEFLEL